jgi:hypothetical protein
MIELKDKAGDGFRPETKIGPLANARRLAAMERYGEHDSCDHRNCDGNIRKTGTTGLMGD